MVGLVVLVLVVFSSQLSKCAYRGGVFDKADAEIKFVSNCKMGGI